MVLEPKKTILAKDFDSRQDLENSLNAQIGTDIKANREAGHQIVGTRAELKKLYLSDTSMVYGVRCLITDKPTDKIIKEETLKRRKNK